MFLFCLLNSFAELWNLMSMSDSGLTHAGTLVLPQRGKTSLGLWPSLPLTNFARRKRVKISEGTVPARACAHPALSQPLVSHLCLQDYIVNGVFIAKRKNVAIFEAARCFPASEILHFCSESSIEVLYPFGAQARSGGRMSFLSERKIPSKASKSCKRHEQKHPAIERAR